MKETTKKQNWNTSIDGDEMFQTHSRRQKDDSTVGLYILLT
jgi:hypothetical protein